MDTMKRDAGHQTRRMTRILEFAAKINTFSVRLNKKENEMYIFGVAPRVADQMWHSGHPSGSATSTEQWP